METKQNGNLIANIVTSQAHHELNLIDIRILDTSRSIETSNRPLIRKEGELTGLSLTVKKEIVTNPHKIGFNEDNVMVIDY